MNLNQRSVMVAVLMAMSAATAAGCKAPANLQAADAPPAATDDAKVSVDGEVTIPAPPALKDETPGAAPSEHHVWSPGYWHYDVVKLTYLWEPGYWQDRLIVAPIAPPPIREELVELRYQPAGNYFWAPGYWRWTGATYAWAPGYWAPRMEGWGWVRPYWVSYGGRWECHGWGWERRTPGWGWDHHDWSRPGFSADDRLEWERRNREGWGRGEVSAWDRREHDHRVNPATASHLAAMPRPAEINHATVVAHEPTHESPGRGPAPHAATPTHEHPRAPSHGPASSPHPAGRTAPRAQAPASHASANRHRG